MRRTELKRTTPLKAKTPLSRTAALNGAPTARSALHANSSAQRHLPKRAPRPGIPAKVRKALAQRSGGLCEMGQPGCTGRATEAAHRIKRGIGGRKGAALEAHDVLSNLLHLDHFCHQRLCHAKPAEAYVAGWMLREGQVPTAERVLYRGAWRWLTDCGQTLTSNPTDITEEAS